MATGEYKTVNTLSMSSVSRVRKVTPANESDVSAVTLTKQGTDVQKLKWICASLAISTVIISTTFGVLTHNMMQRMEENVHNSDDRLSKIESGMMKLVPRNGTDTYVEIRDLRTRIENLEAGSEAQNTGTQNKPNRNSTGSRLEYVTVQDFINETRNIWENVEENRAINDEHTAALAQLQRDWDFVRALVQNQSSRISQVETDRNTDRSEIGLLSSRVIQLEADLETEKVLLEMHSELILANNESLIQLQSDLVVQNQTNMPDVTDRLTQIETSIGVNRSNLLLTETKLKQLKAFLTAQNASLQSQNSKIEHLELNITDDWISGKLCEKRLQQIEASLTVQNDSIQTQNSKINELESQEKIDKDTLSNHTARLTQLMAEMDEANENMVQIQTDFVAQNTSIKEVIDRLLQCEINVTEVWSNIMIHEDRLDQVEALLATHNASLQTHASNMEEVEAQGMANMCMLFNHSARLLQLETNLAETNNYGCEEGYHVYGTSCYKIETTHVDWFAAGIGCSNISGYLVEITDACENDFVSSFALGLGTSFWIGGSDQVQEGEWRWVHSQTKISNATFSDWGPGRPDNWQGNEHYLLLRVNGVIVNGSYWEDVKYWLQFPYICEKERWN